MPDLILPDSIPIADLLATHPDYNPMVSTPSGLRVGILEKYCDLYRGGEQFEKNKNKYLRRRQIDNSQDYRNARLSAAFYSGQMTSLINWLAGKVFQEEPRIDTEDEYWNGLNEDADGTGRDLAALLQFSAIDTLVHKRSYLVADFPESYALSRADALLSSNGRRAPLDAYICRYPPDMVDDWGEDDKGELTWIRTHTHEPIREGVGQPKKELHTWCYITPTSRREYQTLWDIGTKPGETSKPVSGGPLLEYDYDGMLPVARIEIPDGLWVMNHLASTALAIFNADAALAFLYDTNCFQMPVIQSSRDVNSLLMSEVHAMKLDVGENAFFLAPQGTPFEQLRQYIDKLESRLYLLIQAMALQAASKDEHGRQSGVAKQRDMEAAYTLMAVYRGCIKDALEKVFAVIKYARKEEDLELPIEGLDQKEEDEEEGQIEEPATTGSMILESNKPAAKMEEKEL